MAHPASCVARGLSRALPWGTLKSSVGAERSFGAGFQQPVLVVYSSSLYSPPYVPVQAYSRPAYTAPFQQQFRGRANRGLGLTDESFLPPVQQMAYLSAYGGSGFIYGQYGNSMNHNYSTTAESVYIDDSDVEPLDGSVNDLSKEEGRLHPGMSVEEMYLGIQHHLGRYSTMSVTWLNRMFSKCSSTVDFAKAIEMFHLCQSRKIETTPETGTLLIKAACRAGVPDKALTLLRNVREVRLWPTLGGIHYLMINFALKKDTDSVLRTFEATRERRLKPNVRTYHILIRECVDHQHIDQALRFASECKAQNIVPNRVMYNILMNGCRKAQKPRELLELRGEMDSHNIELNDTTVKFTVLAHLMLNDVPRAVDQFIGFTSSPTSGTSADSFAEKFVEELSSEPEELHHVRHARSLFNALAERNVRLSDSILSRLAAIESGSAADNSAGAVGDTSDLPLADADIPLRHTV